MASDLQQTTKLPFIRIETGISGCFSESKVILEIQYGAQDEALARITRDGEPSRSYTLMRSDGESFWERMLAIIEKPETSSGTRTTNSYYAKVRWQKIDFVKSPNHQPEGDFSAISNEFTAKQIEEFLPMFKDSEKAGEIREMLANGLHQRAHEIYLETTALTDYYPPGETVEE